MTDPSFVLLLAKILPLFLYPLGLSVGLMVIGLVIGIRRARRGRWISLIGVAVLWSASTPIVADVTLGSLERQYPALPVADITPADVAIVLGGAVSGPIPPRVTSDLEQAADRVLHAARLYRAGKVQRVLVTGGNHVWLPGQQPEAELIRELLLEWGVPTGSIMIAGKSRNTYENAVEVREMFEQNPFLSALLITSASHMPRALAVFQRAGLPVRAASVDIEVVPPGQWTLLRVLPDAKALGMTTTAVKEWMGFWAYCARGYLLCV